MKVKIIKPNFELEIICDDIVQSRNRMNFFNKKESIFVLDNIDQFVIRILKED